MPAGLKRDLGLPSTMAIAIGAMVGSGIFILPALAYRITGTRVVLAFALAAVLVLPAAVSKAEMATAMPVDGGTYVYIERAMGPLLGTIAGVGTWFSLSFKGGLALVGGVPYLLYVYGESLPVSIEAVAVVIGAVLIVVNLVGSDVTGRFQVWIVVVMLVVMVGFVALGIPNVQSDRVAGAFSVGLDGNLSLLEATGAVYVSYAGVTKVASVAEEIEDPSRNIPLGILGSLFGIALLYVLTVWVAVGVLPENEAGGLGEIGIPGAEDAVIAEAAALLAGTPGTALVTLAALLALVSTANAGILSASRYPFAMARDGLAPSGLNSVSERFHTPTRAVTLTGAVLLVLIVVFPILQIAKLASAFQILVFVLINVALIGFREGAVDEYDPAWTTPLYPYVQVFGILAGLALLTQMGTVPLAGAVVITAGSAVWYAVYVRPRVSREGAARTGARRSASDRALELTREQFDDSDGGDTLVAVTSETADTTRRDMLRVASELSAHRSGRVTVTEFRTTPHRAFTGGDARTRTIDTPDWALGSSGVAGRDDGADPSPDGGARSLVTERGSKSSPPVEFRHALVEDIGPAVVEHAAFEGDDFVILERQPGELHEWFREGLTEHVLKNAGCGVLLVEDRGLDDIDEVVIATDRGVYDPPKLLVAQALAADADATVTLLGSISPDAPAERRQVLEEYHTALIRLIEVTADSRVVESTDRVAGLVRFVGDADLLITGTERPGARGAVFGRPADRLVDSVNCTAVMVQPAQQHRRGLLERILIDRLFGG